MTDTASGEGTVLPVEVAAAIAEVTVVVVTHHSAHCVPALATALAQFAHVCVVDNASDDGTPERVEQALPQARVIRLPENLGFGTANNRGLATVTTPFALLLNPDCVMSPADVAQLVVTARQYPHAAIVAPQLRDGKGHPQINYGWPRWTWASKGPGADGVAAVGYACAAAWLVRTQAAPSTPAPPVWRFDEDYFLYYEDEDFCARVFKAGQLVLIDPSSCGHHANRGSVKGRSVIRSEWRRGYHHSRSKVLFLSRHVSPAHARHVRWVGLLTGGVELLLRVLLLQPRLTARSAGRWAGMWRASA